MAITSDDYLLQVELASVSNVAKDSVVNTFALKALDGGALFSDIATHVQGFYNANSSILSPTLNPAAFAHTFRLYHLIEPEPRPPIYTSKFTRAGSGTAMPAEVAICASFAADAPAGTRPARRRGRVYVGPINQGSGTVVNGYLRPTTVVQNNLATAMKNMAENLIASDWALCVWSRLDAGLFPVVRGWVNDEYDTQRRRGPEVTSRSPWTL